MVVSLAASLKQKREQLNLIVGFGVGPRIGKAQSVDGLVLWRANARIKSPRLMC